MLRPEDMEGAGERAGAEFDAYGQELLNEAARRLAEVAGGASVAATAAALRRRAAALAARRSPALNAAARADYRAAYAASAAADAADAGMGARDTAAELLRAREDAEAAWREFAAEGVPARMADSVANDYVVRAARLAVRSSGAGAAMGGYEAHVARAVAELAQKGVTAHTYVRRDGTRVRVPADAYVRNRVKTDVRLSAAERTLDIARRTNNNLVEVYRSAAPRPSHAVWEGAVYCLVPDGRHRQFDAATHYVRGSHPDWAEGLCGYNCQHTFRIWREGMPRHDADPLEGTGYTAEEAYAVRSRQRRLESQLRALKRERGALQAAGLPARDEGMAVRAKQAEIRDLLAEHPRLVKAGVMRREAWREGGAEARALAARGLSGSAHLNRAQRAHVDALEKFASFEARGERYTFTAHTLDQMRDRTVARDGVIDAVRNPITSPIDEGYDEFGRRSIRYIGYWATANVNPDTNLVTTVWRTGRHTRRKYGV